ncbi:MAG: hypothetical protein GTO41_16210, partial [Burkholderiales bacterium]|nr:hypothetical protein [Burkholderiales bacterium]
MSDQLDRLIENDPLASEFIRQAHGAFDDSPADRDLLRRVRRIGVELAEELLNAYLAQDCYSDA